MDLLPTGHRPLPPGVHALVGGKVVVRPGVVYETATIVIRDGVIEAVGPEVTVPGDARIWEMKNQSIYAGLIDMHLSLAAGSDSAAASGGGGSAGDSDLDTATSGINFFGVRGQEVDPGLPGPGYELARVTPENRVAIGYAPGAKALEAMREAGFTAANVVPTKGIFRGTGAFVMLSEANPNRVIVRPDVFQHVAFEPGGGGYPGSLMGAIAAVRQVMLDAEHYGRGPGGRDAGGGGRRRAEFDPSLEALRPVVDQAMRVVLEGGSALMVDRAARVAAELGIQAILLSSGEEWRRPDLAAAVRRPFVVPLNFPVLPKFPDQDDWGGVALDRLRAWDWAPENAAVLRRAGVEIALTAHGLADKGSFRRNLREALDRGLAEEEALAALTTIPARLCGVEDRLGTIEAGKHANLTVVEGGGYFDPKARVSEVWIDGRVYPNRRRGGQAERPGAASASPGGEPGAAGDGNPSASGREEQRRELRRKRTAELPSAGRGVMLAPKAVVIRGATLWTCGPRGRVEKGSLVVVEGKIRQVLEAGAGVDREGLGADDVLEIEGAGLHVTPGLIDCHSHSMILGGVNEGTIPSSAMVRVADVINSETENIYLQLAGGLTTVNLLHGSANPIGGQNQVIKLRDGESPEGLKFQGAPPGIKFALGENVKQSNASARTTRFPQTRMGVPAFMANRFAAAQIYRREWEQHLSGGRAAPRRDLELEAIGEILEGRRLIHCHSYRQDEIVAFLRLMESFGVQVATLQHVLEGYKVADEIASHGAGGSCFSDWWAYKFEVYDAIPYAGSLMRERGVLVSFNSDSSDHARRLNLEAAKAVKYGGTSEEEALKFVTLNPARQLRIDERVGSLEPGKDADFAIWSRSPLDSLGMCLQTWIEGKKYFDRDRALERAAALERERTQLLEKARKLAPEGGGGDRGDAARAAFFREALEHVREWGVVDCLDCRLEGGRR